MPSTPRKPLATAEPVSPDVATSTLTCFLPSLRMKYCNSLAMNRAPTSLNASVGPWNSSSEYIFSSTFTAGVSKASVSQTMSLRAFSSTSSPKKACATWQAISWNDILSMSSKKLPDRDFIRSGMYRPLSGARPLTTASSRVASGALPFVL